MVTVDFALDATPFTTANEASETSSEIILKTDAKSFCCDDCCRIIAPRRDCFDRGCGFGGVQGGRRCCEQRANERRQGDERGADGVQRSKVQAGVQVDCERHLGRFVCRSCFVVESRAQQATHAAGAYMAVQFGVAFSSKVFGTGVMAGGPWFCAQGSVRCRGLSWVVMLMLIWVVAGDHGVDW